MDANWWQAAAAIAVALLVPIGWLTHSLARSKEKIHELEVEVSSLKTFKEEHSKADDKAHRQLKDDGDRLLVELGLARTESNEQHLDLGRRLEAAVAEGDRGRGRLHEKLDAVGGKVDRLIGFHESQAQARTQAQAHSYQQRGDHV